MKDSISSSFWPSKSSLIWKKYIKKYGTTISNMSSVMKKEVKTRCKSVRANLFTVVRLIDWPSIAIVKPKGYLEAYLYISYASLILTSTSPVIPPSLPISLFYRSMLKINSRIFQSTG